MEEVKISLSKTKIILMFVGCLLFVAAGIWFLVDTGTFKGSMRYNPFLIQLFGILAIVFFGVIGFFLLKKIWDDKPALILNKEGLHDNSSGVSVGFIKWEDVEHFQTLDISGQKLILVKVSNPLFYIDQVKGPFKKRMVKMNHKFYGSPVHLSANAMKMNYAELLELLENYLTMSRL